MSKASTSADAYARDWRRRSLGDVVGSLSSGVSVNSEDRKCIDGEIGVLKTSCVFTGVFQPAEHKAVVPAEISEATEPVVANSIIVSRMNTPDLVGASAYVSVGFPRLFLPDRLWQVRAKQGVCARWLGYVIGSPAMRMQLKTIASGTSNSMKNIAQDSFLNLPVLVPPPAEQQRIVAVLDTWDRAIDQTERLAAIKKRRLSALLARHVLTERRRQRRNGFHDLKLNDLGNLVRGVSYDPERDIVPSGQADGVAVLTATNVQDDKTSLTGRETRVVASRVTTEQLVRENDFVLSMSNGSRSLVGKAGLVRQSTDRPAAPGAFCAVFRPKDKSSGLLASVLFQSEAYREQLHIALAGSSINNLTNGELEQFTFHVSSKLLRIDSHFFQAIGDERTAEQTFLEDLCAQKRGLTQKLLSGQWRLDTRFDPPSPEKIAAEAPP